MTIVQGQTTSFKYELYQGVHDLATDVLKIALYTANANLNQSTTAYASTNEISGPGYVAGGVALTGAVIRFDAVTSTAWVNFDNIYFSGTSFITRCALIYNASKSNKSVAVLDFGSDKIASGVFTISMPADTATTALIRSQ